MKRLIIMTLALIPCLLQSQVTTKLQKGYVRTQSFVSKTGERVVGAIIYQKEDKENSVYSLSTPEEGYFELPLRNTDASGVYHIGSVKGPKGTQYKVLYPQPNDRLEFTPSAPLTIVLQSNREVEEYATNVKNMAIEEAYKNFEAEKARLLAECEQGRINNIEKDSIIESMQSKLNNYKNFVYDYIREDLQKWDFEMLDERHKKISIAMETGNYSLADSLLRWRTDKERMEEYDNAVRKNEEAQKNAAATNEIMIKKKNGIIYEKNKLIDLALQKLDFDSAIYHMENRLYYDGLNVTYLCDVGEMYEIHYNDYRMARTYYQKALENSSDDLTGAICLNHLGDVHYELCEYAAAQEYYDKARILLEPIKEDAPRHLFNSYLGLGNVNMQQAKFSDAAAYYKKCTLHQVESINSKAYWWGKIGLAQIKLTKNDFNGAKADMLSILKGAVATNNLDIATVNLAYGNYIECLITVGEYDKAIGLCNEGKEYMKKHSTPRNTYIANLLANEGLIYIKIGRIKESERCYNEAIDIYQNILGKEHPNYANACILFAEYYTLIGDFRKSDAMSEEALELMNAKFGKNHLATVDAHYSKYSMYSMRAEYEKAKAELDTIKKIYQDSGLMNEYKKIKIRVEEAELELSKGETGSAIKAFHDAIDAIINYSLCIIISVIIIWKCRSWIWQNNTLINYTR